MHYMTGGLVQATMEGSEVRVRQLILDGADLEESDSKQQTSLLIAAKTDQFDIAEILIDAGANVLTTSRFGWTVGYAAETSRIAAGPDADARLRVLDKLRARGFPFPAPHPDHVKSLMDRSAWPPDFASHGR
jgi:hypothetical protein